jgi:hypothetical protein
LRSGYRGAFQLRQGADLHSYTCGLGCAFHYFPCSRVADGSAGLARWYLAQGYLQDVFNAITLIPPVS